MPFVTMLGHGRRSRNKRRKPKVQRCKSTLEHSAWNFRYVLPCRPWMRSVRSETRQIASDDRFELRQDIPRPSGRCDLRTMSSFFEDFQLRSIETPWGALRLRMGGNGEPFLLLHGHPRTHTTWWRVAPLLAHHFTVVCVDLPGFGQSYQPDALEGSSGRAKARALHACMKKLGFDHFAVQATTVGHTVHFALPWIFPRRFPRWS